MIRKHIVFHGDVQGVGFRYRARYSAEANGCTGRVRNEWDGTVTMEIQGDERAIDQVLWDIDRGTYIRIEQMESRTIPLKPEERSFRYG